MNRLTYYEVGYARYDFGGVQYQNEIANRLAAYEDTGLEPEEIAKDANTPNKWISTAERQPEKSDYYLVCTAKGMHLVLNYSKKHNKWNAFDSEDEPKHALEVTHWMHLPEPPEAKEND